MADSDRSHPLSDNFKWLVSALVIPVTTGVYGYFQERQHAQEADRKEASARAERDSREALAQRSALVQALLPDLLNADENRRNTTLIIIRELDTTRQIPPNLQAVATAYMKASDQRTRAGRGTSADADVAEIAAPPKVLAGAVAAPSATAPASGPAAGAAPPPPSALRSAAPLVYIQVYSEGQREKLQALQKSLREKGIGVPGIENVTVTAAARNAKPPIVNRDRTTVLYFHPEDAAVAQRIADEARSRLSIEVDVKQVPRYAAGVPRGQMEVWVAEPKEASASDPKP